MDPQLFAVLHGDVSGRQEGAALFPTGMEHGALAGLSATYTLKRLAFNESRLCERPVFNAELSRQLSDSQT